MVAASAITETVCQAFSDLTVGVGSGGVVEVATDKDRIWGAFDLGVDRIGLIGSFPVVVFHFLNQIFGGFDTDFQGLAGGSDDAAIGIDAGGLEMVVDHTKVAIVYPYVGYHRHVPGVFVIGCLYLMDRIAAIDRYGRMVRAPADRPVGCIGKGLPDAVRVVIAVIGGFLETDDIGLLLLDISGGFVHGVLFVPIEMAGVVGDYGQRGSFLWDGSRSIPIWGLING